MKNLLYKIVAYIARIHTKLLGINDSYEYNFSDKQLHFLVIGILGMLGIFVFYPLFRYLAKKGHVLVIAWLYTFTLILGLTFAIEIGQGATGTGIMEFADIVAGIGGFILMFAVFALLRELYHLIRDWVRSSGDPDGSAAGSGESDTSEKRRP